jgi:hypothetical protein
MDTRKCFGSSKAVTNTACPTHVKVRSVLCNHVLNGPRVSTTMSTQTSFS